MDFKRTNQAVLKSMFLQMDKATFIHNAQDLKSQLVGQKITLSNANYIFALNRLYNWCKVIYKQKFVKK
jgi:hypothetical protein